MTNESESILYPIWNIKIGDKVKVNGYIYPNSNENEQIEYLKDKLTYISRILVEEKHPYKIENYGWIDKNSIELI